MDVAARDAILFQTSNIKLQQKILAEDCSLVDTIKYSLVLEQTKTAAEALSASPSGRTEDGRLAKVEDQICALSAGKSRSNSSSSNNYGKKCEKCNFSHIAGKCLAKDKLCFDCGKLGHFVGAKVCQGKKKNTEKPEKKEKMGHKDKRNKRYDKRKKEKARCN